MRFLLLIVFVVLSVTTNVNAQMVVCTLDTRDRTNCEAIRGLCERVFKLDAEKKIVLEASEYPRGAFRPLNTRMWTELRIEASSEGSSEHRDKDGSIIFSSSRVTAFDRALGSLLEFDEYKDGSGKILDTDGINRLNQQYKYPGGYLFGALPDRRRMTGSCKVQEKVF